MTYPTFVLIFLSLLSLDLQADIFTWQDQQGQTHFGDRLPDKAQASEVKLRINTYQSPEIRTLGDRYLSRGDDKVILYSAKWCGVCIKAKRFFIEKNIRFEEYDVEKSQRGRRDFKRLQGKGVPIILVGDQRLNGFSPERFESIYQRQ